MVGLYKEKGEGKGKKVEIKKVGNEEVKRGERVAGKEGRYQGKRRGGEGRKGHWST